MLDLIRLLESNFYVVKARVLWHFEGTSVHFVPRPPLKKLAFLWGASFFRYKLLHSNILQYQYFFQATFLLLCHFLIY